jgi:hypothetical protein
MYTYKCIYKHAHKYINANTDTRKFARAGSEAKCTESAMKGDYDNIIEALEYGR